jgi:hypothetical protein
MWTRTFLERSLLIVLLIHFFLHAALNVLELLPDLFGGFKKRDNKIEYQFKKQVKYQAV